MYWWECFTFNQKSEVRALGKERILLGVPLLNWPFMHDPNLIETSRSPDIGWKIKKKKKKKKTIWFGKGERRGKTGQSTKLDLQS